MIQIKTFVRLFNKLYIFKKLKISGIYFIVQTGSFQVFPGSYTGRYDLTSDVRPVILFYKQPWNMTEKSFKGYC